VGKSKLIFVIISTIFVVLILVSVFDYYKTEEHPRYFTSDSILILEGKPFFPIGIYSVNPLKRWDPPTAFDEIKAAGFNSVHTYEFEPDYLHEYIKSADSVGLKVLIYPGDRMVRTGFHIDNVRNFVNHLAESSTILSWYLADEPELGGISPAVVKQAHNIIKEIDPYHFTSVVVSDPTQYANYMNVSNVFMIDPYPIAKWADYRITMVSDKVEAVLDAMRTTGVSKPLWAVLQAFGCQNEKNKGWGWDREPTKQEIKAMTYLAIVKGVSGIFYYTYHGSQYYIKESPKHWDHLKAIVGELREIYPLLVSGEDEDVVVNTIENDTVESSLFWTARQVTEGNNLIKPGTYLIVVNGANRPVTATFELNNHVGIVRMIFEDGKLPCPDGSFTNNFKPYEVHIYGLE